MALLPGTRLGSYDIVAKLGEGGMGEVYRATDTKLKREVAIKVLPESVAADHDRLARFRREAEVLASLNHPNIAGIYGLEESGGLTALVMELVEGEDLSQIIARGPIAWTDAWPIAKQIAEALEAAHDQGIVHRDLKPANIKVRADGTVKVLDFGLAKAMDPSAGSSANLANSPTMTSPAMTGMGVILGTAAYMSPEQAKGRAVDRRADIWAFGVVLYEMLTGRRAFEGEDVSDLLVAVLSKDVDLGALPPATPPAIVTLIRRCLVRDPKNRLRDIGEARLALSDAGVAAGAGATPALSPQSGIRWPLVAALTVVALGLGLAIGAVTLGRSSAAADAGIARFGLDLESGLHLGGEPLSEQTQSRPRFTSFAVSPDGRQVVYVGHDGTASRLYHRALDQDRGVPLPGTEGIIAPVFSPDSLEVLFVSETDVSQTDVKRVAISGGPARTIATVGGMWNGLGLSWTDDGYIVGAGQAGIVRLPAGGGTPETLIAREPGEQLAFADVLPDGRAILFNVQRGSIPSRWDIVVQSVGSNDRRVVVSGGSDPRYVDSGHILFMRGGALLAVPFDLATLQATGDEVVVVDNVMHAERGGYSTYRTGQGHFAVSRTGVLTYLTGGVMQVAEMTLLRVNRRGEAEPLPIPPARSLRPQISPDGSRIVWSQGSDGEQAIWIFDVLRGVSRPVTRSGNIYRPVWSPDGRKLAVQASRDNGPDGLALLDVDGSAVPQFVGPTSQFNMAPSDWSVNNVLVLLDRDVWTMPMDGTGQASKFFEAASGTSFSNARFSPDGRFLSYSSNETGTSEVYVRPFPAGTPITRVSVNGGTSSAWSNDGRELFYRQYRGEETPNTRMMAVPISITDEFRQLGPPREVFSGHYVSSTPLDSWDLGPDGRFIMEQFVPRPDAPPITRINVVLNWFAELTRLAPAKK